MVNTRRTESSGLAADNGPRYRTRNRVPQLAFLRESRSSSGEEEEEEGEEEEEDSNRDENKSKQHLTSVRELRSRFACNSRNYKEVNLLQRELRSSRKHLAVFSLRKMHDELESEEDCYSPRHHNRRSRYSKSHFNRIERRTALSLRPITRKSYKDHSPATCNSEESDCKLRRSMRTRTASWLTDNMHKIGYPNFRRKQYSDEDDDSRDALNHRSSNNTDPNKRNLRHNSQNVQYIFSFQDKDDVHSKHNKCGGDGDSESSPNKSEKNLRTSRGTSHDKENKEDNSINGKAGGAGLRKAREKTPPTDDDDEEEEEAEEDEAEDNEKKNENKKEEPEENGHMEVEDQNEEDESNAKQEEEPTSESDEIAKPRTRNRNRSRRVTADASFTRSTQNRKMSDSSSTLDGPPKGYSLRDRPQKKQPVIISRKRSIPHLEVRNRTERHLHRERQREHEWKNIHPRRSFNRRKSSSSSSDTSGTDDRHRKMNQYNSKSPHSKNEKQMKAGECKVMPMGPDMLDPKITFKSVGGLDSHVQCLKEMILLPMMYPEIFRQFQIQPPRGVLFHGPPGTGKTLIARALANECSFDNRKVAFFMRKGADLLSKWIGESEKQLRLLFEQASEMKPSIIFFDELDGLAPVRSSRQDQIHASIVSTLLALMDGIDNRGEVIVIGATNRIDAIDPALRRPGRFDRELYFPLPARKEREDILKVHVSQWSKPPTEHLVSYLAESAAGYCGSDLRALCSEAVIQSFRRTYPQVYTSNHRLLLNPENVIVEKLDFLRAKSVLVPAAHRINQNVSRKLVTIVEPLLKKPLSDVLRILDKTFPHGRDHTLAKVKFSAGMRPSQLILSADGFQHGQTSHLAPAILHSMEHLFVQTLDLATLYRENGRSPEEACVQVFHEAKRNVPSVIYIPNIDLFFNLVSETVIAIFISQLIQLDPNSPILILATADSLLQDLPSQINEIFSSYRNEVYELTKASSSTREEFFKPLIIDACKKPPRSSRERVITPPPLPKAPTPPPAPLTKEAAKKVYEQEERTLRELRIFLRDMCKKLASNRLFFMFTKPVDTEEVPDYPTIIKQPMDLETMMTKVDFHRYESAKDFLSDIELICHNALEYNPAKSSTDKQIRHRACSLRDYAFALIKNEMDSDFEEKCQDIAVKRKERNANINKFLPPYLDTAELQTANTAKETIKEETKLEQKECPSVQNSPVQTSPTRKRKIPSWKQGYLSKKRRRKYRPNISEDIAVEAPEDKSSGDEESKENLDDKGLNDTLDTTSDISFLKGSQSSEDRVTAPLTVDCDTTSATNHQQNNLQSSSSKTLLNDLMSPSELLNDPLEDDIEQALNESISEYTSETTPVTVSLDDLKNVLRKTVNATSEFPMQALLDLHYQFSQIVKKYMRTYDRKNLPNELLVELSRFENEHNFNTPTEDQD